MAKAFWWTVGFDMALALTGGHSGVNVYSDGGLETFAGFTGWVQLEVHCTNTTILKGGRPNRYCLKGPSGQTCFKAAIVALWVPLDEIPSMVFLP